METAKMTPGWAVLALCLVSFLAQIASALEPASVPDGIPPADVVRCRNGAVVCVSEPSSTVGLEILKRGGNSVDAAVATAFALAVTYPEAGNLGGGGYLLLVPAGIDAHPVVFDFRETAPAAATREMFVDPQSRTPHRRVGVPGTVRGLALAHQRFGRLPWRDVVNPAVKLAQEGFALDAATAKSLNSVLKRSDRSQSKACIGCMPPRAAERGKPAAAWCSPSWVQPCEPLLTRGPTDSTRGASPN